MKDTETTRLALTVEALIHAPNHYGQMVEYLRVNGGCVAGKPPMKQDSGDTPIACGLSDPELRKREATLLAQFRSAVTRTEELGDGYVFHVPGDKKRMAIVLKLIVAERECCPFLTFELTAQPNMGPLSVRVTGPDGTKDFLKAILCNAEESF